MLNKIRAMNVITCSPSVAHDQHTDLSVHRLQLLQGSYDKDSCLPHTKDGLRNTLKGSRIDASYDKKNQDTWNQK